MFRFDLLSVGGLIALCAACSANNEVASRPTGSSGAGGGGVPNAGTGGSGSITLPPGGPGTSNPGKAPERKCEVCTDFPEAPIFVEKAPTNAPELFGDPANVSMGALCLAEPQDGTLLPWNWLRPRIRWTGSSDVYEVRITTPRQKNALVAYTTKSEYYIPREVWSGDKAGNSQGLARNNFEEDITVAVRGVKLSGGTPVGASARFRTAAAEAAGSMVYWANIKSQTSETPAAGDAAGWLMGFSVGDEAVVEALRVLDVRTPMRSYAAQPKPVACIGCHTSTPDGKAVSFTAFWPWGGAIAGITPETRGRLPETVTPTGLAGLQQDWLGAWTYSAGQWKDGWRVGVVSYGANKLGWPDGDHNKTNQDGLLWVNIAATAPAPPTEDWAIRQNWTPMATGTVLGILPRTGDTRAALMPDFSNAGDSVAYTSTSSTLDGRIGQINDTDIYTVPFANGKGGAAQPLAGAAAKGVAEYYPNHSGDDQFVAFNRIDQVMSLVKPNPVGFENHLYYRPESEIWIAPTKGAAISAAAGETSSGGAIRLKANDPDSCGTKKSPGVLNSWAKFSPRADTIDGKTYYFLVFSSTRDTPDNQRAAVTDMMYRPVENLYSRLFMAAFTVQDGKVTTHPAVYLWNQEETSNNLTPAWDDFKIPEVIDPEIPR